MPKAQACESLKLTASGQVTTAGKRGWLFGYILHADISHGTVQFTNGNGGTVKWEHQTKGETAEGDLCPPVDFGNNPIEFTKDIYVVMTNTPIVCVRFIEDKSTGA